MKSESPESLVQDQPTPAKGRGLRILQAFLKQPAVLTPEEGRELDRILRENRVKSMEIDRIASKEAERRG